MRTKLPREFSTIYPINCPRDNATWHGWCRSGWLKMPTGAATCFLLGFSHVTSQWAASAGHGMLILRP